MIRKKWPKKEKERKGIENRMFGYIWKIIIIIIIRERIFKYKKKTKKRKKEEGQKILIMYVFGCKNEKNGRKEMEKVMLRLCLDRT